MKPIFAVVCISLLMVGCSSDDEMIAPQSDFDGFVVPSHFPEPVYRFEGNEPSKARFELGRRLFYDTNLSLDGTVSCGSCHAQVHAFADHGTALSTGVYGREGKRNAPAISNLAWLPSFMADGGINHIEVMPLAPLTDSAEMAMDLNGVVTILNADDSYVQAFESAFGDTEINTQNVLFALTQFQGLMVSSNSKYDAFLKGDLNLSEAEMRGMELFNDNCGSCHSGVLQSNFSFQNNGLDSEFEDLGRARITLAEEDMGKFRVPSLRNVRMTGPYMHDGRFYTLDAVLDHYVNGITESPTLAPELAGGIPLTEREQQDIIQFLHTLSDFEFISDMRFSEPRK